MWCVEKCPDGLIEKESNNDLQNLAMQNQPSKKVYALPHSTFPEFACVCVLAC